MKKLMVFYFIIFSFCEIFSQHLPLKIGNQWHYDWVVGWSNYAAIAVDTVTINEKVYFKIERRHYNTGELLATTYDRLEADSAYYRIGSGQEYLIINFNWPDGYTTVTQSDSDCISIKVLHIGIRNIWGFNTDSFDFWTGQWCTGMEDTLWALTPRSITRLFGSYWAQDGSLKGAIIDGIAYGTLHPLPVELLSFTSSVFDNGVGLHWTTATETNNSGFQIERRETKNESSEVWENIGFVNGHGTTTEPQNYSYKDENLSSGIYQYRLKQIDFDGTFEYSKTIEVEINPPAKFTLEQNYPNPFNPSTSIQYTIPSRQFVSLKVFNSLGEEIATLVNDEKPAGNHTIEFNPESSIKNLPAGRQGLVSGIYLYQLKAGDPSSGSGQSFIQTRKMILLK